jgi:hypothetical protein
MGAETRFVGWAYAPTNGLLAEVHVKRWASTPTLHGLISELLFELWIELRALDCEPVEPGQFITQRLLHGAIAVSKTPLAHQAVDPRKKFQIDGDGNFRAWHVLLWNDKFIPLRKSSVNFHLIRNRSLVFHNPDV